MFHLECALDKENLQNMQIRVNEPCTTQMVRTYIATHHIIVWNYVDGGVIIHYVYLKFYVVRVSVRPWAANTNCNLKACVYVQPQASGSSFLTEVVLISVKKAPLWTALK